MIVDAVAGAMDGVGEAFQNSGDTAVFDNVNMFTALVRALTRLMNSGAEKKRLGMAVRSLSNGLDEIIFIGVYLLVIDRVLKTLWKAGKWIQHPTRPWQPQQATSEDGSGADSAYEASLVGALRSPARLFGWSMLLLWFVDAATIIVTSLRPQTRSRLLPKAISWVLYTNVVGRALAALKNWWLESGVLLSFDPPPSATQRALARRGSGILLWSLVLLICGEGLSVATGVKLNSILSFAGVGGIAVGLATKDLLTNLIGGCLLFLTNPFAERDKITMTNLDQSRVMRVGWYQTVVLGDNEEVQSIPNAKFISNKISNRSRRSHRCMKQSFFLTYEAMPELKEILAEMQEELLKLPSVDARSREFRLFLKSFTQTAIEIEAEIHFRGNDGTEFRAMRQKALLVIAQVVAKRGCRFAVLRSLLAADGSAMDAMDTSALPAGVLKQGSAE